LDEYVTYEQLSHVFQWQIN